MASQEQSTGVKITELLASAELSNRSERRAKELINCAVREGDVESIALLMQSKSPHLVLLLNAQIDEYGNTPLLLALLERQDSIVNLLVNPLVNIAYQNKGGYDAITLACDTGSVASLKLLLAHNFAADAIKNNVTQERSSALMMAVSNGLACNLTCVKLLLEHQAVDLNYLSKTDAAGCNALMLAVELDNLKVVQLLLPYLTAQVVNNTKRIMDATNALAIAAKLGRAEILQELLNYPDIKVEVVNNNTDTPLLLAAKWGHAKCVHLLLTHGATRAYKNRMHQDLGWFLRENPQLAKELLEAQAFDAALPMVIRQITGIDNASATTASDRTIAPLYNLRKVPNQHKEPPATCCVLS